MILLIQDYSVKANMMEFEELGCSDFCFLNGWVQKYILLSSWDDRCLLKGNSEN